jgi:hypothetical protein
MGQRSLEILLAAAQVPVNLILQKVLKHAVSWPVFGSPFGADEMFTKPTQFMVATPGDSGAGSFSRDDYDNDCERPAFQQFGRLSLS